VEGAEIVPAGDGGDGRRGDTPALPPLPGGARPVAGTSRGDPGAGWGDGEDAWGWALLGIRWSPRPGWLRWGGRWGVAPRFQTRSLGLKGVDGAFYICFCSACLGRKCGVEQLALDRRKKLNDTECN